MDTLTIAEVKVLLEKIETEPSIMESLNAMHQDMSIMPMSIEPDFSVKLVKFVRNEETNGWEIVNRISI